MLGEILGGNKWRGNTACHTFNAALSSTTKRWEDDLKTWPWMTSGRQVSWIHIVLVDETVPFFIFSLCWTHCFLNHKFSLAWLLMQPRTAQLVPGLHKILAKLTLFVTATRGHSFRSFSHLSEVEGRRIVTLFSLWLTRQVVFPHYLFPNKLQQKKKTLADTSSVKGITGSCVHNSCKV